MVKITKEQLIECIKHFIDLRYRVDLVRTYCLENGKDPFDTEIFLQTIRDVHTRNISLFLTGKITENPNDLLVNEATYIISKKKQELGLLFIYNKEKQLIGIY